MKFKKLVAFSLYKLFLFEFPDILYLNPGYYIIMETFQMSGSLDPHVHPPINPQLELKDSIPLRCGPQALYIAVVLTPPLFPWPLD